MKREKEKFKIVNGELVLRPSTVRRYEKMIADIKSGKEKTYGPFETVEEMMKFLSEDHE